MGAWYTRDTASGKEFSWKDADEHWRAAAFEFFLRSTPGIATFPEYLEALTQAFHAEVFDATGEHVGPKLKFAARIGDQFILPAGPLKDGAVEPMRLFFRGATSAWRDPDGVPQRSPFVSELLHASESCTQSFFTSNDWLGVDGSALRLSLEKATSGNAVERRVPWDQDPPEEVKALASGYFVPVDHLEEHPQFQTSVAKYLPDHPEDSELTVSELATLATTAANPQVRKLAAQSLPSALLCCKEEDVPRGENIALLGRAIASAEMATRAQIAYQLVGLLSVNTFDLEAWRALLTQLATDGEPLVRARFALTCRLNAEAVLPREDPIDEQLRADPHPMVVAAWSPDPLTLRVLAWHSDWTVRSFVAHSDDPEALDSFVAQSPALRQMIAFSDKLSLGTATRLASDDNVEVRRFFAARHSWTQLESLLDVLVADSDKEVRRKLAENPRLPSNVLERLATDPDVGFTAMMTLAKVRGLPQPSLTDLREWLAKKRAP